MEDSKQRAWHVGKPRGKEDLRVVQGGWPVEYMGGE